jgi:uncharacterized protein (TIGR03083 family)
VQVFLDGYERVRRRVCDLAGTWDGATVVPSCPGWTVGDVLAHLVGLARDVVTGDLEGFATPSWTARHVTGGAAADPGESCREWAELAAALREATADPERNRQVFAPLPVLVFYDAFIHEDDLRLALGLPPADDQESLHLALEVSTGPLRRSLEQAGLPTLRVVAEGVGRWDLGDGPAGVTVTAPPHALARSLAGRLRREEVRAFDWSADSGPYLEHWVGPVFAWPTPPD